MGKRSTITVVVKLPSALVGWLDSEVKRARARRAPPRLVVQRRLRPSRSSVIREHLEAAAADAQGKTAQSAT